MVSSTASPKPNHPWTNGQVERMNRTLKEATVRRYHYETHQQLRASKPSSTPYNFAKRLKTLRGLTPYEHICKAWADQPRGNSDTIQPTSLRGTETPRHDARGIPLMREERLEGRACSRSTSGTATSAARPSCGPPVMALSLGGLRRKIEIASKSLKRLGQELIAAAPPCCRSLPMWTLVAISVAA